MENSDKKDIINEYVKVIINNLPQWNHVGALSNPDITKEKENFIQHTNKIDRGTSIEHQLKMLSNTIKEHVPDNHIQIKDDSGKNLIAIDVPSYKITEHNIAYKSPDESKDLNSIHTINVQADKPAWLISTKEVNNPNVGIIAIPSFGGDISEQTTQRKLFVETLFSEKENKNWKSMIFDLRGNTGGDAEVIKEIGERLGETPLIYADHVEPIQAKTNNETHKRIMEQKSHTNESSNYLTHANKFEGSIFVLQDGWNAFATEGAIYMMSQLPNVKTVVESTIGMFSGGSCVELPMTTGKLVIGTEYRERTKNGVKIEEKKGTPPDIECNSKDALDIALDSISKESSKFSTLASSLSAKKEPAINLNPIIYKQCSKYK